MARWPRRAEPVSGRWRRDRALGRRCDINRDRFDDGVRRSSPGVIVRINGETQSGSGALADRVEMLWVTPAMDGLFRGPASDRRRFLDRLVVWFDPSYRTRVGHFERAMRQRNRLLEDGVRDGARFDGLEMIMAETGVAIAAARAEAVDGARDHDLGAARADTRLAVPVGAPAARRHAGAGLDASARRRCGGRLRPRAAVGRERDRAAGRALEGPHRSDLSSCTAPRACRRMCAPPGSRRRF